MKEKHHAVSSFGTDFDPAPCNCDLAPALPRSGAANPACHLERRLEKIQEMARIAYWVLDMESGRISWSKQVFKLLEHRGKDCFPTFHEYLGYYSRDGARIFRKALSRAVRKRERQEFEMHATLAGSREAVHRCIMIPETDGKGKVAMVQGYIQDITVVHDRKPGFVAPVAETGPADGQRLTGLLSICSHCKKVRDDHGLWRQIESYITERSNLFFSHGICPECLTSHYSEYFPLHIAMKNDKKE